MNIGQVITEAKSVYGLHQRTEMQSCLEWLQDKELNGFVEIGSANGGSFHCWASFIPEGPKVSVDWNRGFGMAPSLPGQTAALEAETATVKARNNKWRERFTDVRIVEGDCLEPETVEMCKDVLDGELVDWLFIDAIHEYDPALKDYNNYKQFVKKGGFIGFHDVCLDAGMEELWVDLKKDNRMAAEFLHGHGIGILHRD